MMAQNVFKSKYNNNNKIIKTMGGDYCNYFRQ